MNMMADIEQLLRQAGEKIKAASANTNIQVDTKTDRKDLVTNMDKEIQRFLIDAILTQDPDVKIMAEENGRDQLNDFSGRVYIIDPIDGTLNFVLEQENFCVMVGIYEDKRPVLGFIYDVVKEQMLCGGPSEGVYCNGTKINAPQDLGLSEGLLGLNSGMYAANFHHARDLGQQAMGVRMLGCAGVELSALLLGQRIGYISNLSPWDYAAGGVLLETFGMKMSRLDGQPLSFSGREYFIAGTKKAYTEMITLTKQEN